MYGAYFEAPRFAGMRLDMRETSAENVIVDVIKYIEAGRGFIEELTSLEK